MTRSFRKHHFAVFAWALCLTSTAHYAQAHDLSIFVVREGDVLAGSVDYVGGAGLSEVHVEILNGVGFPIGAVVTDTLGKFRYIPTMRHDHEFVVTTDDGHRESFTVPASELPSSLPFSTAGMMDPSAFKEMVEEAVSRQTAPLRQQLNAHDEKTRLRDIVGGIGYIVGLAGFYALVTQRRRRKGESL